MGKGPRVNFKYILKVKTAFLEQHVSFTKQTHFQPLFYNNTAFSEWKIYLKSSEKGLSTFLNIRPTFEGKQRHFRAKC